MSRVFFESSTKVFRIGEMSFHITPTPIVNYEMPPIASPVPAVATVHALAFYFLSLGNLAFDFFSVNHCLAPFVCQLGMICKHFVIHFIRDSIMSQITVER
jgi:hypothetical protein